MADIELNSRKILHKPGTCCGIAYTGATTEKQKAVMLSNDNFMWTAYNLINSNKEVFECGGDSNNVTSNRILSYLPLYYVFGQITDIYGNYI